MDAGTQALKVLSALLEEVGLDQWNHARNEHLTPPLFKQPDETLRYLELPAMPASPEAVTTVYQVTLIQISLIYFFSDLAKLIQGGVVWAHNVESLHLMLLMRGSSLGKLILSHPFSRRMAGSGTIVLSYLHQSFLYRTVLGSCQHRYFNAYGNYAFIRIFLAFMGVFSCFDC